MPDGKDRVAAVSNVIHQHYFVDVLGTSSAAALSVVSCRIVERMGEAWSITVDLTHPDALSRKDYLNKDATFTLAAENGEARRFSGYIDTFSKLKTTKDLCTYRFVLRAHVARLRITRASRIFQQNTGPQIIEAILRRHGFRGHQFVFRLRRNYPEHAFRLQYQCSDWDYLRVLMEQEGIYCYFEQSEYGDVLVFADDIDHYVYQPTLTLPYREPAGLKTESEAILSLQTHAQTVPQSFLVADYNPELAWERVKGEANVARKDTTTYGQPYVYGTGHLDQAQAKWEAQLRHEEAIAWQVVYDGESTHPSMRCARVVHTDEDLPDASNGMVIVEAITAVRATRDTTTRSRPFRRTGVSGSNATKRRTRRSPARFPRASPRPASTSTRISLKPAITWCASTWISMHGIRAVKACRCV